MSIKDLFGKKSNKIVTKEQADKLVDEVESHDYVSEVNKGKRKFIPKVDYSEPKNFAKYGSAEKYYQDTVEHIYGSYPYDGSEAEKNRWHRESSALDTYIYDTQYPKAVGHLHLNANPSTASLVVEAGAGTFTNYIQPQYIYIQGGPNKDSRVSEGDEYELSKQFPPKGGRANIWDENIFRASNLGINPDLGNSIELWWKLDDSSIIAAGSAFCLFDLWNKKDIGDSDYVRLLIEVLPSTGDDFSITYKYGSGAEGAERVGLNITAATKASLGSDYLENWNHYSFTMKSTADGVVFNLYVNGVIEDTKTAGGQITSEVPQENYVAIINGYNTKPTSSSPNGITYGIGGASGLYIDDFRFWKAERNGRDVGRNWFTNVSGGTNTDNSKYSSVDNVDIGVYYKFNEGILDENEINHQDSVVLDYSGRISNGTIQNYNLSTRKLTSAIDESTLLDEKEEADPIIYSTHPLVASLNDELMRKGLSYDMTNNASFYHTMPEWILEEDEDHAFKIKELTQALSSYFDSLHLQIEALTDLRSNDYQSLVGKAEKPYYFAKSLLRSVGFDVTDIFNEATVLEEIASRGETEVFDLKIQEVKNVIYQNIYNNITHIYKTKGTEKSFRNLIRCFGIDDELVKINLYADGVDYTLEGRRSFTALKKNYADFNNVDRHESIVYSRNVDASSDVRDYLAGPTAAQSVFLGTTLTAEVIFPKQLEVEHPAYNRKNFTEVSLFGTKEADVAGGVLQSYAETPSNIGSFRVLAVKPDRESLNAKLKLVYTDSDGHHELITDEFKDIYDNSKWNIAVRIRPIDVELGDYVNGGSVDEYQIDFYGVNTTLDTVENEFKLSASYTGVDISKAQEMIQSDKLCYVGALRTNLEDEATEVAKSDVKVTDLMYWYDYLTDEEIKIHAIDASNFGRLYPNDDAYSFFSELSDGTSSDIRVPRKDTLALYWNFQNVTSSDSSGNFKVNDVSVGGEEYITESRYGWFTDLIGYRHQARGDFKAALPNDTQVVNREYQYTARHRLPEVLSGDDMVEIRTQDDDVFVKGSKPINHFFAIEKSMSQVISTEMLSLFASIVEFNDLIGQPVNRYRMQYKSLEKFRSLFYERVENVPSFEKYVEFYKWIDSSLGLMLQQLIPASGNFSESMRNMVENHILERSKYWTKFPTLEKKQDPPEGTIRGVRELTYDWEHGHAPLSATVGTPISSKAISFDGTAASAAEHHVMVQDSIEAFRFSLDETTTDNSFASQYPGFDTVEPHPSGDLPFSVSAWIKPGLFPSSPDHAHTSIAAIVSKLRWTGFGAVGGWFFAIRDNGKIGLFLYDDNTGSVSQLRKTSNSVVLTSGEWTHVAATYGTNYVAPEVGDLKNSGEFTDIKLYVNGVEVTGFDEITGELAGPDNIVTSVENRYHAMPAWMDNEPHLVIGNDSGFFWPFDGEMADVAVFDKVLTSDEISEVYNHGSVKDMTQFSAKSSMLGWWKMGDDLDGGTVVKNYASSCHDGILTNGPTIVNVDLVDLPSDTVYDNDENCLWRSERAERSDTFVTSGDADVDADRESIRKAAVRDILGQTKIVKVGAEFVEQGKPTLYDVKTSSTYEGSTYATRRLSRPYKLNLDKSSSITGGPNFADALLASPNDTIRGATEVGHHIELDYTKSVKDAEVCNDDYKIVDGHKSQKRRAQELKLIDAAGVETTLKGSLVYNSLYGAYPNDTDAEFQNLHHDSYGQDHEVPVQGPFTNQWVGGNQHRHIDLNTGSDDENTRAELYKNICGNIIKHPYDVEGATNPAGVYMAARYTRDGLAKRPLNIANIKSSTEQVKLGNYTYDYEVVQTSGRSNNNRWLVRNPNATPDSISSTYITGLYDYTLPVRGRSEHVFVERFSAPGSPATLSRGALDYQAEEFSPYNSLNFRNLKVRNHLNFWHKEHSMQFGYREDYIHGTPDDEVDVDADGHMESHDFGGNTPNVASWHKNNRNAAIRMKLENSNVYAERTYDNFFVGHQIPRSDWQYSWISSSALPYGSIVVIDDEHRQVMSATQFPYDHDGDHDTDDVVIHPRYSGYVTEYPNASISLTEQILSSASYASYDIDFSYGNTAISEAVHYDTQTIGSSCGSCKINFTKASLSETAQDSLLNAILINRNGPYQGASWKSIRNEQNPIVRGLRRKNQISIQNRISSDNPHGHEKHVEPPTTWNKPMVHLLSENNDGVGTRILHSYSNNLEGFANPKLTKRTGFVKRNEQFYDRLFEHYNPNTDSPIGKLYDFIGLSYKEYVFPKHRNVGLQKVRTRINWDILSPWDLSQTPTGDLRIFWKDNKFSRVKNYVNSRKGIDLPPVNALNYGRKIRPSEPYLNLDNEFVEHLKYDRSIFSMDVFNVQGADDYVKYLGDLQYTGKENYFAFILSTQNMQQKIPIPSVQEGESASYPPWTINLQETSHVSWAGQDQDFVMNPEAALTYDNPTGAGEADPYSYSFNSALQSIAFESLYGSDYENHSTVFDKGLIKIGPTDIIEAISNPIVFFKSNQLLAPEPVAQLYYNPFSKKYEEEAWLYRSNILANKNPWNDSYSEFNQESRVMVQNYGLVAEFKISEHMNKYIVQDGGDFQTSNYNIFTLQGASYDIDNNETTEKSGKTRFFTEKKFYTDPETSLAEGVDFPSLNVSDNKQVESLTAFINNAYIEEKYKGNKIYAGGTQTVQNSIPANFASIGPTLLESESASWASKQDDSSGTGRHRWFSEGHELATDDETYKTAVYRDASTYPEWTPVYPHSYGDTASLKFNYSSDISDDYLVGEINETVSENTGLKLFRRMTQTDGATPIYDTATPFTFSIWAKPKSASDCEDENIYDGRIKGLITFGNYVSTPASDNKISVEQLTVYSNFPMPDSFKGDSELEEKYQDGMGLTVYIPGAYDKKLYSVEQVNEINLFHFFDINGNPAVLSPNAWNQVVMQVIPAIDSSPLKIKLEYNKQRLYGIHRGLLMDATHKNVAYRAVPIHASTQWGTERYSFLSEQHSLTTSLYKVGKSRFADIGEEELVAPIDGLLGVPDISDRNYYQYHFKGELMELSMWQGIMSDEDIDRLTLGHPTNVLEEYINGEILGGYTSSSALEIDFGSTSGVKEFEGIGPVNVDASDIAYSPTPAGISTDASRSKFALIAWHRLGVLPVVETTSTCEDWDDAFFDSYVHTDPVRFYDNIIEDHDAVTGTATRRVRLRVNALKKLIPYRGFYPQDRTLQLAKLFSDKMKDSFSIPETLHEEQALQAALQPFFAPGILYNSIKAGVAVDWPAFTNETGLEPSNILEENINLPHKEEDLPGTNRVVLTSAAPNWYVKRQNEYDARLGLHVYDTAQQKIQAHDSVFNNYNELKSQQPKYIASAAEYSKRGFVILSEPNTRIPFEGLVALDSVLPSKNSSESDLSLTNYGDVSFKHFDLEISGWDTEGVEIVLTQPEPIGGYGDKDNYVSPDTISSQNIKMVTKKIKIGDPDGIGSEDDFDVSVDFRRSPTGWAFPMEGVFSDGSVSINELNEELAVKICRAINKRPDIHFVAVPGYTPTWKRGNSFSLESKTSDDDLATLMPVVHPEIFGINFEEVEDGAQPYDRLLKYTNLGLSAFANPFSPKTPIVGNQRNGTWRIRIIYVGLPKLTLDMSKLGVDNTNFGDTYPEDIKSLMAKPFTHPLYDEESAFAQDITTWDDRLYIDPPLVEVDAGGLNNFLGVNWKEAHIVCPFVYNLDPVPATAANEAGVPTYWNTESDGSHSGIPYSFFEGGAWVVDSEKNQTLADMCYVSINKDTSIFERSQWIAGYGWFGFPYYGTKTELGVKFVDEFGSTIKQNLIFTPSASGWSSMIEGLSQSSESDRAQQGPFGLYAGVKMDDSINKIRVQPEPHKIYLMAPEYYLENSFAGEDASKSLINYKYPYFEYNGSNGDPRFEMAMHNFLAEVPNFFLKQGKLTSFVSKQEKEFKTMEAGKTYYMDITMHKSDRFATALSPHTNSSMTMEGRYYGPAFRWQSLDDYRTAHENNDLDEALIKDPAQAPYVPPYMYGKSIARLSFECTDTRKYSLEEILAGVRVENLSPEQTKKFLNAGASLSGALSSPAWNARTTISSSMNLFGKVSSKNVEYSAQSDNLFDDKNEELQKFVPQIAKDPEGSDNDIWTIGTKFECPLLNFYSLQNSLSMTTGKRKPSADIVSNTRTGTGIWAGYGVIPDVDDGVFVTIEDTFKQSDSFGVPKNNSFGSLIDVCGFQTEKKKIGELAEQKEISEAVVMIPFVDTPSDTTAETVQVDGRNFFKINKDLFNLQKANIENGKDAVQAGQWLGVTQNIPSTSISRMIKGMKKYNLPPRYDFIRYPLKKSQSPFAMYIFEFHHVLSKQDLSDIWQGLPPQLTNTAVHDSVTITHDLSAVDFFEENNLPKNVRWMVFKVKKRANDNYFATTSDSSDDRRFEFDFEFGKMPPKYNYNWPYDFFTMLEMIQVEAGLDIVENKTTVVPQVKSNQGEVSTASLASELNIAKINSGDIG